MIDFYFWTTPNGYKILLFLEETGIEYRIVPINISLGEQFEPEFLKVSPNNKIPAIVDGNPTDRKDAISLFESGAILEYLADKAGRFIPADSRGRADVLQWLYWQVGGLGPILGQYMHFSQYANETVPYGIQRFRNESHRLLQVLDNRLADREFVAGNYSIADMASYPWILRYPDLDEELERFPNVHRWFRQIAVRPATLRAYRRGATINQTPTVTAESKKILLGQDASTIAA